MLAQLEARGLRNLEALELELGAGVHLILGANGAGKTSLLEAVYLLATTRSFRTSQIADCCRHGESRFRLAGEVEAASRIRLELTWQDGQRQRSVNARRTPMAEHLAALPVVAWTASDVEILIGSPAERRRFLDRGVVGCRPPALEVLTRYRKALLEKRRLLQRPASPEEWESWNRVLAEAAVELIRLRAAYTEELSRALGGILEICALGIPPVELRYRPSPAAGGEGLERFIEELDRAAGREQQLERPLIGPHRDELKILWNGHELRRVASAGERKALGLALAAAHGEVLRGRGRHPTYLLDDVDIELDRARLEGLWRALGTADQLFATSNRPWVWEKVEVARRWHCEAGRITPEL